MAKVAIPIRLPATIAIIGRAFMLGKNTPRGALIQD
jgi:hypothetical protein